MGIKQLLRQKRTYETYNTRVRTEETNKRQIKQKEFIVSSCTKRKYGERWTRILKRKNKFSDNPRILFFRFNSRTQITINEIYIYRG